MSNHSKYSPLQVRSPCSQNYSAVLNPAQDIRVVLPGSKWVLNNADDFKYGYVDAQSVDNKNNTIFEFKQNYDLSGFVGDCSFFLGRLNFTNHANVLTTSNKSAVIYAYTHEPSKNYCLKTGRVTVLNPSNARVKIGLSQIVEAVVTFKTDKYTEQCDPKWSILPSQTNRFSKYIKILRTELFGFDVPESYASLSFSQNHPIYGTKNWDLNKIPLNSSIPDSALMYIKESKSPNVQFHIWFYIDADCREELKNECVARNTEILDLGGVFIAYGEKIWCVYPCVSYRSLKDETVDRTLLAADGMKPVYSQHQKIYLADATFNPAPQDTIDIRRDSHGHLIEVMSPSFITNQPDTTWQIDAPPVGAKEDVVVTRLPSRQINDAYVDRFYLTVKDDSIPMRSQEVRAYAGYVGLNSRNSRMSLKKSLVIWLSNKPKPDLTEELPICGPVQSYGKLKRKKSRYYNSFNDLSDDYSYNNAVTPPYSMLPKIKRIKRLNFKELFNQDVIFGTCFTVPMVMITSKKNALIPLDVPTVKRNLALLQQVKTRDIRIIRARKAKGAIVDEVRKIVTIDDIYHGDAIVVEPGDRISLNLKIPENEGPWVANAVVFGTTKSIVVESVDPIIPGANIQTFTMGFFWKDLVVDTYGHHLVGGVKFSNQSAYLIVMFYIDVTAEYVQKGTFHLQNPEYLATIREMSAIVSAVKHKKSLMELEAKKIDPAQIVIDPDITQERTYVSISHGDTFVLVINRKPGYIYSLGNMSRYVRFINLNQTDPGKFMYTFQTVVEEKFDGSLNNTVTVRGVNTLVEGEIAVFCVNLMISDR